MIVGITDTGNQIMENHLLNTMATTTVAFHSLKNYNKTKLLVDNNANYN
jgi:hypothetical protein